MTPEEKREYAVSRIENMADGLPYKWGGDNPMKGFDCSGLAIEYLKTTGLLPEKGDWTANQFLKMFLEGGRRADAYERGHLVFWCDKPAAPCIASHVEICVSDELAIGARGSSKVATESDAVKYDAYVMVRPIMRGDPRYIIIVDPFKGVT